MPKIGQPFDDHFVNTIKRHDQMIRMLATQQNRCIVNAEGQPVINEGLVPGSSPALYGFQFMDPTSGDQVMMIGQQSDGSYSVEFFGSNGSTVVLQFGKQSGGNYALTAFDASGNERVQLGELANGDYGLKVTDPTGVANEVWPLSSAYADTVGSTSSTSPTTLSGSPSVSAYIGASGDAVVTVSAYISTASAGGEGVVDLVVDGTHLGEYVDLGSPTVGLAGNVTSARRFSQWYGSTLGPNASHTFSLEYWSTTGGSMSFHAVSISVQPL